MVMKKQKPEIERNNLLRLYFKWLCFRENIYYIEEF
jgi:hypothetical protein